jgi:hypothetical protein
MHELHWSDGMILLLTPIGVTWVKYALYFPPLTMLVINTMYSTFEEIFIA